MSAAILFLVLVSAGRLGGRAGNGAGPRPAAIPPAEKAELRRLLPDPAVISAVPRDEPKFYSSNLFEYLDGGADVYLDYGLVALLHQEYRSASAEITLDIYNLGSPENAFGMYAAERAPNYHFLRVGAEGYGTSEVLNFLDGKFYVKLSAFGAGEKTGPLLERLAQAVAQRMGPPAPLPEFLSLFPTENLVAHSIKYVKKAPLGHAFLAPALTAYYGLGAKPTLLAISRAVGSPSAREKLELVKRYFASSGKLAPAADVAPEAFRGSNDVEGEAIFFATKFYVIVCVNPPRDPRVFFHSVIARVEENGAKITF
jgi:hypothetical protein